MRLALFIEQGREQIILTPETETEKSILAKLNHEREFSIRRGTFYACQGGWTRQGGGEESTIIVLDEPVA